MNAAKTKIRKKNKLFADLDEADLAIFGEFTGIGMEKLKDIFDDLHSKNPDGFINHDEFAKFYKDIDPDKCKLDCYQVFTDMIFHSFDSDNDGVLTVMELLVGFATITKGKADERLNYLFDLYDIDDSGTLSKDEIKNAFKGLFIMSGTDPTDFMCEVTAKKKFEKLDANNDGKINKKEFVEGMKKVLGKNQNSKNIFVL